MASAEGGLGHEGALRAGVAKVEITPENAVVSAKGMSFRLPDGPPSAAALADGVLHDPLHARVLVLDDGDTRLGIVSLDLVLFSSARVVAEAKRQWGMDHVLLCCTHTHSGMVPRGMCPTGNEWGWTRAPMDPAEALDWDGFSEDPWYAATEEKVLAAIGEATEGLFPARIAAGTARYDSPFMAHNRRLVNPDGTVTMMWSNPQRISTHPVDPTMGIVRIEDEGGSPRVLVVHYASHPVMVMGAGRISRDFPGAMLDRVEQELGPSCTAMFLQGASGDLDPYDISLRGDEGFETMRKAGVDLAEGALRLARNLPAAQAKSRLRVKESLVKVPHRNGSGSSEVNVLTAVLNGGLALVALPAEPFIEHQLNLRTRSPVRNPLMLGLAYCGKGSQFMLYLPTSQAAKEGGYGASECCFVSGDAGDLLVDQAVADLGALIADMPREKGGLA